MMASSAQEVMLDTTSTTRTRHHNNDCDNSTAHCNFTANHHHHRPTLTLRRSGPPSPPESSSSSSSLLQRERLPRGMPQDNHATPTMTLPQQQGCVPCHSPSGLVTTSRHAFVRRRQQRPPHYYWVVWWWTVLVWAGLCAGGVTTTNAFHLRINGGGPLILDAANNNTRWEADTPYNLQNKGQRQNVCTSNPNITFANLPPQVPATLYCTQRFYESATFAPPYQYRINVTTGYYIVKLHFMEFRHNVFNKRIMDVTIEDQLIVDNLDVAAVTGGTYRAYVVTTLPVYVSDGAMTISLTSSLGTVMISGLEVMASANLVTHRINSGSTSNTLVTMNSATWSKDTHALSGAVSNRCAANNSTNSIYCSSRYFRTSIGTPLRYQIPVPYNNALYALRLHFNEHFHTAIGARVYDVLVENSILLDNFDIFQLAPGRNVPIVMSAPTPIWIADGTMTIDFVEIAGDPHINGIEVIYVGPPIGVPPPVTAPVKIPTKVPVKAPTKAPVKAPTKAPVKAPTKAPVKAPTKAPVKAPTKAPVAVPVKVPTKTPVVVPVPVPTGGNIVHRINSGSTSQVIVPPNNIVWTPDQYAVGGLPYNTCGNVTTSIYCTSRYFRTTDAAPHRYDLPIAVSNRTYEVRLHFAEQFHTKVGSRVFDVFVEGALVADNLDIYAVAPGRNVPYVVTVSTYVSDGAVTVDFVRNVNNPQLNGIEVFDNGAPVPAPTIAPQAIPPMAPIASPPNSAPVSPTFQDIVINCGGASYLESSGLRTWSADTYFDGGSTYSISNIPVANTVDDPIYQSERVGTFSYSIPVPVGTYAIVIHLAELAFTSPNVRKFNLTIESELFAEVDIFSLSGGTGRAVTLETTLLVDDGFVSISVDDINSEPKINGIEIKPSLPHVAHSVSNGPYFAVDNANVGSATVFVDGSESHTHGRDLVLTSWTWKKGAQILGTGEITSFNLPVGTHDISLTVVDSGNFQATEATTVTVHPFGYPDITTLTPSSGSIVGGEQVTIRGTGFNYSAAETIVYFGIDQLTGSSIQIINATTIVVASPQIPISVPVMVSVQTPRGRSDDVTYTYVSSTPISFKTTRLMDFVQPTSVEFGPDGKLYVGTLKGSLAKITLNAEYTSVVSIVESVVQFDRAILGIAFDPMDAGEALPPVYISSSLLFHNESKSSSAHAVNGKISRISGANLDVIEDVVTGLPVCDLDHAVNQIQFGNNGELYINIGSNTNGGEPGSLSGSGKMKENYFSASTVVANLSNPLFDGFIEYDAPDDGSPINFNGVSVFAPGLRNPFGLTLHSNGNLYATDNGPNTGYGKMRVGCGPSDLLADQQREDKLVRLSKGKYFGHPNPKRASHDNDPRQCVWRNPTEPTSANYEAPIGIVLSSATGIIEYQADHFNGQLRGNLIHVKYKKEMFRTVLSADGLSANPLTIPGLSLAGGAGLDLAQAPNGNLIEARYISSTLFVTRPLEATTAAIRVGSVFPTRGGVAGGTPLRVYGLNFGTVATSVTVTVGGSSCPIVGAVTNTFFQCTLPGRPAGIYDIVVTAVAGTYTFQKGYRYITGV